MGSRTIKANSSETSTLSWHYQGKTTGKFELHLGSCDLLLTLLERPLCNETDKLLLDRSIHLLEKMRAVLLQIYLKSPRRGTANIQYLVYPLKLIHYLTQHILLRWDCYHFYVFGTHCWDQMLFQEFAEAFDGAALHRDSWDASALHIAFSADPGRWAYAAGHHNRRLKEDELAILDHH